MARILIIDDDAQFLAMLRKTLEREGYEVVAASDGQAGLKSYREHPADLIISDLIMPKKGGVETILELSRDFQGAKIIALSGGGRVAAEDHLAVAKHFGAQYAFSKPVERKTLLKAVQDLIK